MTEYVDTAELAARIPDGHPRKARMLYANELARMRAEERAVDELVEQFIPTVGGQAAPVDLAEQEESQESARAERTPGNYFGVEDIERIAAEDVDALSAEQRADNELHEELKRQAHADRFGEDDLAGVSDEEMWAAYRKTLGMEED